MVHDTTIQRVLARALGLGIAPTHQPKTRRGSR
jgi:hypothetical protein